MFDPRRATGRPDEITANLTVVAEPRHPLRVAVFGASLRGTGATSSLLDGLVGASGTRADTRLRHGLAVRDLKQSFGGALNPGAHVTTNRSEFFAQPLAAAATAALLDELTAGPGGRRELNFTAMGGAYNRVAADTTAFVHRGERFLLEHVADEGPQWVDRSWAIAHPHGSGRVYPNFPDPQLEDWAAAYHGGNLPRLAAAKQRYDPDRSFHFPQAN
ncbi:MAG TPA: BBE domain-containing protein [Streptosporangiaceae bacterium]